MFLLRGQNWTHQLSFHTLTSVTVSETKTVKVLLNQTPWFNGKVKNLLWTRDSAFKSGELQAYKQAQRSLRKGINEAKHRYKHRIEEHFNNNNSKRMWQGIKTLTGYKNSYRDTNSTDCLLSDSLNLFSSRFDQRIAADTHPALPGKVNAIQLDQYGVWSTLSRVNVRKAAGPDRVTGRIIKACADQLAEVFTTIFNLLLLQSAVPTCLKSATIIPVPKKSTVNCLNDYGPVALTPIITKYFERLILSHNKSAIPAVLDQHQFAYTVNMSTKDAVNPYTH